MSGRRTKRLKTETDSGLSDDDAVQALPKLPTEMWTMIFKSEQNAIGLRKHRNKRMANLQLVSKEWYGLIKDNIYFEPKITDELLNGNKSFEKVKAKKIILANLMMEPSIIAGIFRPDLIKKIILSKNVNKSIFLSIANHFSENGGVQSLVITQGFFNSNDNLFSGKKQEKITLRRFLEGITKLVLDVPLIDLQFKDMRQVINLKKFMKSVSLPNLTELKISAHWRLVMSDLTLSFYFRHSTLAKLDLKLADLRNASDLNKVILRKDSKFNGKDLELIQLENISIEGKVMDQVAWHTWATLLEAQRHLFHLKISGIHEAVLKDSPFIRLDVDSLILLMLDNYRTLTSLHLVQFQFDQDIDAVIFRRLNNLKTLTLDNRINGLVVKLENMTCLCRNIEVLIIRGLVCEYNNLKELARGPYLRKLRHLELGWIGSRPNDNTDNIPRRIIQVFLEKNGLDTICFSPVQVKKSRVWTYRKGEEYMQYLVVDKKGYLVPLPPDLGYRNAYIMNLKINCKDVKMLPREERKLRKRNRRKRRNEGGDVNDV